MTPQQHARAKALLEKFHAGKCTPEELALLDEWYNRLGEDASDILPAAESTIYREAFLENMRSSLPKRKIFTLGRVLAAACILLMAATSLLWINNERNEATPQPNPVLLVSNGAAGIKKITLPDSSEVWLNANASVRWEEDPVKKERHLSLTGEGYFDIHSDSKRPFFIHTRDLNIQVLGTAFSVEAYPGEKMSRVSLLRGKVQVKSAAGSTILRPGYSAMYVKELGAMMVSTVDTDLVTSWKDGGFAVNGLSMHDAVMRLCEHYGYKVEWKNKKDIEKNISVAFSPQSFEKMLGNLCYMNHKKFTIAGKLVIIH